MDDGQTFFMFVDSAHVNSMFRQPSTEPVVISEELLFQTSRIFLAKNPCPHQKDQWKTFPYKINSEDAANWVAPILQPIRKFQFNRPPRAGYLGNDMEFDSIKYDSSTPSYRKDRFGDFRPFLLHKEDVKPLPPPSIRASLLAGWLNLCKKDKPEYNVPPGILDIYHYYSPAMTMMWNTTMGESLSLIHI